ncbi:DUF3016 domain-containing protein [Paraglaciecola sp. 2405UD69-4]|uniref:DUF3016 domain-containing protein n=1 Tax=Paraglaciecola sp. 2405UD69-4 TaxID=3391836 RepID=UPI0039C93A87
MKLLVAFCACLTLSLLGTQVTAATQVEVQWQNPEDFRDVQSSSGSRKRFEASTFKNLDEYLQELSRKLPEGSRLVMTVTDLDLAGQVFPASFVGLGSGGSDIRVIKAVDIPRMNFNYQLMSSSGELIQESDVELKDMSFLNNANHHFRNEPLRYEKNMLKRWFDKEFSQQISRNLVETDTSSSAG